MAELPKMWDRLHDSCGVLIEPGQKDIVLLAVTVAIDIMMHSENLQGSFLAGMRQAVS